MDLIFKMCTAVVVFYNQIFKLTYPLFLIYVNYEYGIIFCLIALFHTRITVWS